MNLINIFLIANTFLSNLTNIICTSVTLAGLYFQKSEVRGFKAAVADMATVNLCVGVLSVALFPVNTYLLGQFYPDWLLRMLVMVNEILLRTARWVLGIIFLYRTLVVLKPQMNFTYFTAVSSALAVLVPIYQVVTQQNFETKMIQACDYWCLDQLMANETNSGIWKKVVDQKTDTSSDIMDVVLMTAVTIIGFKCRKRLHKFFNDGTFSEKTIRLQKELSKGMLMMIAVHLSTLYPLLVQLCCSIFLTFLNMSKDKVEKISTASTLLSAVFVDAWQMPVLSVVVLYSVRGFVRFRHKTSSADTTRFKNTVHSAKI